ncbi:MAG: alpha/beta hydrolase [Pseudomonadota bacterium]
MPQVNRDGVNIYYDSTGDGPAVLLSHGYSATGEMWSKQVAEFSRNYRVITWDMRGHGRSDSPEDPAAYSEAATVDDMAAILGACGVSRAVIGGLSLGGYMSLAFHLKYPQMTRALMLFDTGPGYRNPKAREAWNATAEALAKNFETKGLDALDGSAELPVSHHRSAQGLANAARGMLAQCDARVIDSFESIKVPTLVLVGEKDEPFLAATDYMANKIAGAKKVTIPDAGHASNIDQPKAFNEAVEAFLASLP